MSKGETDIVIVLHCSRVVHAQQQWAVHLVGRGLNLLDLATIVAHIVLLPRREARAHHCRNLTDSGLLEPQPTPGRFFPRLSRGQGFNEGYTNPPSRRQNRPN